MTAAALHRRLRRGEDAGSMPLALLLTIVGLGLSLVLASVLTDQQVNTRSEVQRANAVNAAQSGLDVALGAIRSATRVGRPGSGDPAVLPCNVLPGAGSLIHDGTNTRYAVTGRVSPGGSAMYSTQIFYLASAPPSGDIAWARANALSCPPALGTLAYAFMVGTGVDGSAVSRTLAATYTFTTSRQNANLVGGQIRLFGKNYENQNLCLAAAAAVAGAKVVTRACDATSGLQTFTYEANLNLALQGTDPRLCVDGGIAMAAGATVLLKDCSATDVRWQQWGSNDFSAFTLTRADNSVLCMNLVTTAAASDIVLKADVPGSEPCEEHWSSGKSFSVDPAVGSGRAGPDTHQLVNLEQFSRCVDVTGNNPDETFLLAFPCKQKPGAEVLWNQRWNLPEIPTGETNATGPIHTTVQQSGHAKNGRTYCLSSPGTVGVKAYVTMTECVIGGAQTAPLTWMVYAETGRRSTNYRIESAYNKASTANLCMTPNPSDLWNGGTEEDFNLAISKLMLATCDGSNLQKWNAVPTTRQSSLRDVVER
jgi:hypothetical protein